MSYKVCEGDGCNLEQVFEIVSPDGKLKKFVCQDCASERQALFGWRMLRFQQSP